MPSRWPIFSSGVHLYGHDSTGSQRTKQQAVRIGACVITNIEWFVGDDFVTTGLYSNLYVGGTLGSDFHNIYTFLWLFFHVTVISHLIISKLHFRHGQNMIDSETEFLLHLFQRCGYPERFQSSKLWQQWIYYTHKLTYFSIIDTIEFSTVFEFYHHCLHPIARTHLLFYLWALFSFQTWQ